MTSIALLCFLAAGAVQEPPKTGDLSQFAEQTLDYQVGPGDVLSIHVSGVVAFDQIARVSNSGRIHVPYVGIMLVAGHSAVQIEHEIARLIKEHELVNEPSVRVQIEQHRAQPAYVIGEFVNPGQFVITSEMYLLDLISKAGGLMPGADEVGFLYRRHTFQPVIGVALITGERPASDPGTPKPGPPRDMSPTGQPEPASESVMRINLTELRNGARPELNVRLQGGDILYVPRMTPKNIYVIGEVLIPGGYTLPRRGEVTAARAIIYAGGPTPVAKMKSGFLMRHDEAGVRQAIPVDFAAIIEGKRPDIPVRAGDIIFIPNSAAKTVATGLLNLVPRLIQQFLIF